MSPVVSSNAGSSVFNAEDLSKEVPHGGICCYVSSAHLKLAPEPLALALTGNWSEDLRKRDGRYYVNVYDRDEAALLTLQLVRDANSHQELRDSLGTSKHTAENEVSSF